MNTEKMLPCVMIGISLVTSVIYFCFGDARRGFYWLFAAGITATVTF